MKNSEVKRRVEKSIGSLASKEGFEKLGSLGWGRKLTTGVYHSILFDIRPAGTLKLFASADLEGSENPPAVINPNLGGNRCDTEERLALALEAIESSLKKIVFPFLSAIRRGDDIKIIWRRCPKMGRYRPFAAEYAQNGWSERKPEDVDTGIQFADAKKFRDWIDEFVGSFFKENGFEMSSMDNGAKFVRQRGEIYDVLDFELSNCGITFHVRHFNWIQEVSVEGESPFASNYPLFGLNGGFIADSESEKRDGTPFALGRPDLACKSFERVSSIVQNRIFPEFIKIKNKKEFVSAIPDRQLRIFKESMPQLIQYMD